MLKNNHARKALINVLEYLYEMCFDAYSACWMQLFYQNILNQYKILKSCEINESVMSIQMLSIKTILNAL